jgi:hypothetical protein
VGLRTALGLKARKPPPRSYWERRRDHVYLQHIRAIVHAVGIDARSLLDVGTNGCPYPDWFDWIPRRVSLDLEKPYQSPGVVGIKADFLRWPSDERFDLVTCLQVLEHIPDASAFARALLARAPRVLVSVPYKWKPGNEQHVHDPVDEEKVTGWFGTAPRFTMVSTELRKPIKRLIAYFERDPKRQGW